MSRYSVIRNLIAAGAVAAAVLMSGCATSPGGKLSIDETVKQQRVSRAQANLSEGRAHYDNGSYDAAARSFLEALDSGYLSQAEQLMARKLLAFGYCISNRLTACKEEFEKVLLLEPKFELAAAESGHPVWGAAFRQVKADLELRKTAKPAQAVSKSAPKPTDAELKINEATGYYSAGEYDRAIKGLQEALALPINDTGRVTAHKLTAFCYCLTNRVSQCRLEFEKLLAIRPDFDLEPAEAGHPSWGAAFRSVKAKMKSSAPAAASRK